MSRYVAQSIPINRTGQAVRAVFVFLLVLPIAVLTLSVWPSGVDSLIDSFRVFDGIALQRFLGSLYLGLWTVFFSLILASPVYAFFLSATKNTRRWLVLAMLAPLSFPSFGVASGWLTLISRFEQSGAGRLLFETRGAVSQFLYTLPGGGFLLALCFWPIVCLVLVLSNQPRRSQFEAARLCLTRGSTIWRICLPAWKEPIGISCSIILCLCFLQFEVPSLLQLRSYPLDIFTRFSIPENEWKALILCFPYLLVGLVLALSLRRVGRLFDSRANESHLFIDVPWIRRITFGLAMVVFFLSVVIPLWALLLHAGSLSFTLKTFADHSGRLVRSVLYASLGAILIVASGIVYTSSSSCYRRILAPCLFVALFACPGILLASGWLQLRTFWPGVLPSSVAAATVVGAYVTHRILVGYAAGVLLWKAYGRRQREFERLLDLKIIDRIRYLHFPAMFRPAVFGVILTALLLWGDVAITIMLHPPGGDTLAVEYYNLLHFGNEARTAAIGFLLMLAPAFTLSLAWFVVAIGRKSRLFYES